MRGGKQVVQHVSLLTANPLLRQNRADAILIPSRIPCSSLSTDFFIGKPPPSRGLDWAYLWAYIKSGEGSSVIVNFARRAHNHNWNLDPITRSLLDTDFYKLLMLQFIW